MQQYIKYLKYIESAIEVKTDQFMDDWEPVGRLIIGEMIKYGLIKLDTERFMIMTTKAFDLLESTQ